MIECGLENLISNCRVSVALILKSQFKKKRKQLFLISHINSLFLFSFSETSYNIVFSVDQLVVNFLKDWLVSFT